MFVLDGKRINIDAPYEDAEGNRYGNLRDPAVRAQVGVVEMVDPERKDERFYFVQEIDEAPYVINTPKSLGQFRGYLQMAINGACEAEMHAVKSNYPESEVLSWSKQETEARAYLADPSAETPLINALSSARGVPKAELAQRVVAKSNLFAAVSGAIIGKRQALEDALAALPDEGSIETHQAEIEAILQAL